MKKAILRALDDAESAIAQLKQPENVAFIEAAAALLADAFERGKKLLIAGNGGSLCDAMHFAEELSGQFRKKRDALPALALSDQGLLSCIANDFGYEWVFARGVEAYGQEGDVFAGLTTSGNSPNIIRAVEAAKARGMKTIAFLGKSGGQLKGKADLEMVISGFPYSDRIQEAHMAAIHILIEMVEARLFAPQLV